MRLGPLRHPWFAAFSGSVGLGGIGDEVARLALPLLILDLTHSIAAAATFRLVQALPYVFFGGILGVLIDRADKRKLLIACDALSVALTLTIPLSVAAGIFTLNLLYLIGFLLGTVEVAWGVATDFSVVPALVEPDELTSANAAYFGIDRSARVVGPTIGGLAIAAFGTANAMYIAALAFVPTLFVFVLMPPIYDTDRPKAAITPGNIARELGEGFSFVWRSHVLRWLLVLMFIANLGQQGIQTLVLYVLREENRLDEVTIGIALSLAGAVTVLASFIAPRLARGRRLGAARCGGDLLHAAAPLQPERTCPGRARRRSAERGRVGGSGERLHLRHVRGSAVAERGTAGALSHLRGRAPVRPPGRPGMDDARGAAGHGSPDRATRARARPHRRRRRSSARHRAARAARADARRQLPLGLRGLHRRAGRRRDRRAGRHQRHRYVASALLRRDGRMEQGLRRSTDPHPRRRPP